MREHVDSNETLAARIAIEMLLVGTGASVTPPKQRIFVVGGQRMTSEDLVSFLVALPKPSRCELIDESGPVGVRCTRIGAAPILKAQQERAAHLIDWRTHITSFASFDSQSEPRVLIIGSGASLVIPLGAMETFVRDYRIAGSLTLFEPTPADKAAGVHARVEIRRAANVQFLGSLP